MRKLTGEKLEAELARLEGMRAYEHQYESAGIVCGIDEAEINRVLPRETSGSA